MGSSLLKVTKVVIVVMGVVLAIDIATHASVNNIIVDITFMLLAAFNVIFLNKLQSKR